MTKGNFNRFHTQLIYAYKSIRYLFVFRQPGFSSLAHVDVVLQNQSYFIISWKLENAFGICIQEMGFFSFNIGSSAYLAIPSSLNSLRLKVFNTWHSQTQVIQLCKTELDTTTVFPLQTVVPNCLPTKNFVIKDLSVKLSPSHISITNIHKIRTFIPQPNIH